MTGRAASTGNRVAGGVALAVTAGHVAFALALYPVLAVVLPHKVLDLVGTSESSTALGAIAGIGALVAVVTNIGVGVLSDRRVARGGSRRSWLVVGIVLTPVGLLGVGHSPTLVVLGFSWAVSQFGANCVYSTIVAFLPDRVAPGDRGRMSGWFAIGQTVGLVVGFGLAVAVGEAAEFALLLTSLLYVALTVPFLIVSTAMAEPAVALDLTGSDLDAPALKVPGRVGFGADFGKVWLVRFVATLANSMATLYLLLYLETELRLADASTTGALVLLVAVAGSIPATVVFGRISDRTARRKEYVALAMLLMSAGYVVLAFSTDILGVVVAAFVLGVGYGAYLSVDQALTVDVLPDRRSYARDLGIVNLANAGPQVAAPLLAATVLGLGHGYTALYLLVAAVVASGCVPLVLIRSVR